MPKRFFLTITFLAAFVSSFSQQLSQFSDIVVKGNPEIGAFCHSQDGSYLFASTMDHVNGVPTGNLVRVNATGQVIPGFHRLIVDRQIIKIVELPDGKLLIGGYFQYADDVHGSLLRLNADGTIDNTFHPLVLSIYEYVSSLFVQPDGKIVVAGSFPYSTTYNTLLRLDADGNPDLSFSVFTAPHGYITGLIQGTQGEIFVSDGTSIQKLTKDGAPAPGLIASLDGYFFSVEPYGDKLIIGGLFTKVNNIDRVNVAIINYDGTLDPLTFPEASGSIFNLTKIPSGILTASNDGITLFNNNGQKTGQFQPNSDVHIFVDRNQKIIIAGWQSLTIAETAHPFMARLNSDNSLDASFVCEPTLMTGTNVILPQPDGKILLGFSNETYGIGESRSRLIRVNSDGSLDDSFAPFPQAIYSVALQEDGKILVAAADLRRLLSTGAIDNTFSVVTPSPGNSIYKVRLHEGKLFASGYFNQVNQSPTNGIVKLNSNGTIDPSFTSALSENSFVTDFAFQADGKIVVVGVFHFGETLQTVARLTAGGLIDESFHRGVSQANASWRIAIDSLERIYIGGDFVDFNGSVANRLLRLTPIGDVDESFSPAIPFAANDIIQSLELLSKNEIFVGARTLYANSTLAVFDSTGAILDKSYTHLGRNSSAEASYYDGLNLYVAGRLSPEDNSLFSPVMVVHFHGYIAGLQETTELKIYPNPCRDKLRISTTLPLSGGTCYIVASNGVVKDQFPADIQNGHIDIDMGKLDAGLYLVRIAKGKAHVLAKVIKE